MSTKDTDQINSKKSRSLGKGILNFFLNIIYVISLFGSGGLALLSAFGDMHYITAVVVLGVIALIVMIIKLRFNLKIMGVPKATPYQYGIGIAVALMVPALYLIAIQNFILGMVLAIIAVSIMSFVKYELWRIFSEVKTFEKKYLTKKLLSALIFFGIVLSLILFYFSPDSSFNVYVLAIDILVAYVLTSIFVGWERVVVYFDYWKNHIPEGATEQDYEKRDAIMHEANMTGDTGPAFLATFGHDEVGRKNSDAKFAKAIYIAAKTIGSFIVGAVLIPFYIKEYF